MDAIRSWEVAVITLGLMEGAILAGASALLLIGLCTEGAPLHRIFGPIVAVLLSAVAVRIATVDPVAGVAAVGGIGDLAGLALAATIAFLAPLGLFWYAWHDAHPSTRRERTRAVPGTVISTGTAAAPRPRTKRAA